MIKQNTAVPTQAIEVLGPWLLNKGDVLNLNSISRQLGDRYALAVSSKLGLEELPEEPEVLQIRWRPDLEEVKGAAQSLSLRKGLSIMRRGLGLRLASTDALRRKRLLDGRRVVGLLDCSGFAYGDQWTTARMERRAAYYRRLKGKGARLVLLPQALGPFTKPEVRRSAFGVLSQFDVVYARDPISREHALSLDLDPERVRLAPDITHLLEGNPPQDPANWARSVVIVPNARMVDKTSTEEGENYLNLLARCARFVRERGFEPRIVIHERNDRPLVEKLQAALGFEAPVYDEDALDTKGFLGACHAVVGSRYHALLSSLSQATPSIGTSWNHKYEAMFTDYACSDLVLSPTAEEGLVESKLSQLLDGDSRQALKQRLEAAAQIQKDKVRRMWSEVEALFDPVEAA